ncbi:phosphatase PAP2 family protein [Nocardia sp. CNY236]|uniref:phosphatase PAP2 family protein n=1 Tax=Nocardia sp. CNY236 TaxID=1169152 RepID=UPI001E58C9B6|nr:phosphatase PAP2 family protein [Nocardia sp. CNY236]
MLAVRAIGPRISPTTTIRIGVTAATALGAAALPATLPTDGGPSALDRALADPVRGMLDTRPGLAAALVVPSNAYILLPLLFLACGWFAYRGDRRSAITMLVVPELAVATNTWLLKPLWGRQFHDYLAYPSGHTVHMVAIAATFVLLAETTRARCVVCAAASAALLVAATGMIGLDYHHPTDILGGVAAALTLVIVSCWAAQLVWTWQDRRLQGRRSSGPDRYHAPDRTDPPRSRGVTRSGRVPASRPTAPRRPARPPLRDRAIRTPPR